MGGLNLYHYSENPSSRADIESHLTTGFLTALQSFTQEARKSEIEFFSSTNEFFLFTQLPNSNRNLVCVFDKNSNRELANIVMDQIRSIIINSHLLSELNPNIIDDKKNEIISDKIKQVIQRMFENTYPENLGHSIFEEFNFLSCLRVLDLESSKKFYEKARPRPLLKSTQVDEIKLLVASLDKISERMGKPNFEYCLIVCDGAAFGFIRSRSMLGSTFASGIISIDDLNNATLRIFDIASRESYFKPYHDQNFIYEIRLDSSGQVIDQKGDQLFPMIEIFFSTVINAVNRMISSFIRKEYSQMSIFIPTTDLFNIKLERIGTDHVITFWKN